MHRIKYACYDVEKAEDLFHHLQSMLTMSGSYLSGGITMMQEVASTRNPGKLPDDRRSANKRRDSGSLITIKDFCLREDDRLKRAISCADVTTICSLARFGKVVR
jgi:hypothetical protein